MRSGVLHAPLIDPAATSEANPRPVRAAARPLRQPYAVVAGAPHAGKSTLVDALIEAPGRPPVDAAAWLVFRSGTHPGARAFVPGHREPRPIALDGLRSGERASRPPRRIEITHPATLLEHLALVDTPGIADHDDATADIALDATERAAGLVYVLAAGEPLRDAQLAFLARVTVRVVFVLTKIDERPDWIDVVSSNRAQLERHAPALARAPWFPVAVTPAGSDGVAELRQALEAWGGIFDPVPAARRPAMSAATVSVGDNRWEAVLDREIRNRRVAAIQQASIDLATIHVRCVQELASGDGCPELPYVLDRALHALSVRVSRQVVADTDAVIGAVFGGLLDEPPGPAVQRRIRLAARRTADTLVVEERVRERVLLLTTTSAVAVLVGPAAVDSLSATGLPEPDDLVLPAVSVGLTASCYQMWRAPRDTPAPRESVRGTEKKDCRRWLQQALRVVEAEIERELGGRYDDLRQSLAIIAADAVDHGVLLA
jgi:hypothetical protein